MRKKNHPGFTIAEVMISLAIFTAIAVVLVSHLGLFYGETRNTREKVFAYEKAGAILTELQAYVDRGEVEAAIDLDSLDDGTAFNPTLTITTQGGTLVPPDHPLSGNYKRGGEWVWSRRITVRPFQGLSNRNVRYVTVRIFKRKSDGSHREVAAISSVINSAASSYPSSQVYDVYFLAMENVPGWWVYMDAIKPFMEATVSDLEARNPGLRFRTHWITKLAYGRNPRYTPYVNKMEDSLHSVPYAYYYPGTMPSGSASTYYYVPDNFRARISEDGTVKNTASNPPDNPDRTGPYYPYTLADHFNNAMRYYDELELFNKRVASGDEDPLTPTWRILLNQMASHPERFHNAILVNLHGELLPMPPLRNYSDPAKDVEHYPYVRAVTHPEKLRFTRDGTNPSASEDVKLRVHTFLSDPSWATKWIDWVTLDILAEKFDSQGNPVPVDYNHPGTITVHGEMEPSVGSTMYATISHYSASAPSNPYGVGFTRIRLHGSPVKHTQPGPGKKGLPADCRLYGLEYVPCPMGTGGTFRNLSSTADKPKNTARWIITLPHSDYPKDASGHPQDLVFKVVTRLGDEDSGSFDWSEGEMENKSVTYAWWAASPEVVPWTERYQFIGDPRHCPYADLMHGGSSFPDGYNPYFDDFRNGTADARSRWMASSSGQFNTSSSNHWPYLKSRWRGRLEIDVPRFTQLLRTALAKSEAVWTTLTGFSYYYMGIGNEIGYDSANGYPSSIPVDGRPWGTTSNIHVDNISSGGDWSYRNGKLLRNRASTAADRWFGLYWIGELYPDWVWNNDTGWNPGGAEWKDSGNLPTLSWSLPSKYTFFRDRRQDVTFHLPEGTSFDPTYRRTQAEGCTSVFLCGTSSSHTFHHQFCGGQTGSLVGPGLELANNYSFPLPSTAKISRPFDIDVSGAGGLPDEWGQSNAFPHFSADILATYYNHQNGHEGSALVRLTAPLSVASPQRGAFIVVNGLDRTVESGSAFIAKYAVVSLVHSFFESGNPATGPRVVQLPRVQIKSPTEITELANPLTIPVHFGIEWKRWDGRPYTSATPSTFAENENDLVYVLSYSRDGGKHWLHVQDDSPATEGILPSNPALVLNDTVSGDETYTWSVPAASFPEGSYLLRVECFRSDENLHYATHTVKFYIDR